MIFKFFKPCGIFVRGISDRKFSITVWLLLTRMRVVFFLSSTVNVGLDAEDWTALRMLVRNANEPVVNSLRTFFSMSFVRHTDKQSYQQHHILQCPDKLSAIVQYTDTPSQLIQHSGRVAARKIVGDLWRRKLQELALLCA